MGAQIGVIVDTPAIPDVHMMLLRIAKARLNEGQTVVLIMRGSSVESVVDAMFDGDREAMQATKGRLFVMGGVGREPDYVEWARKELEHVNQPMHMFFCADTEINLEAFLPRTSRVSMGRRPALFKDQKLEGLRDIATSIVVVARVRD